MQTTKCFDFFYKEKWISLGVVVFFYYLCGHESTTTDYHHNVAARL